MTFELGGNGAYLFYTCNILFFFSVCPDTKRWQCIQLLQIESRQNGNTNCPGKSARFGDQVGDPTAIPKIRSPTALRYRVHGKKRHLAPTSGYRKETWRFHHIKRVQVHLALVHRCEHEGCTVTHG